MVIFVSIKYEATSYDGYFEKTFQLYFAELL